MLLQIALLSLHRMIDSMLGDYRILDKLAETGMGILHTARSQRTGRDVTVEVLHPSVASKPDAIIRFSEGARALARMVHPGIVAILDYDEVDGKVFMVLEPLRGDSLATRLELGPMPVKQAVDIVRQLAEALGAAHEFGVVHRDLKPQNVFLISDPDTATGERVKVLDFSLATMPEQRETVVTGEDYLLGTPTYMAPEQGSDIVDIDHRADLYSLGCILYELLCGMPPFGRGGLEVLAAHLSDEPPPLRTRAPSVSPALEAVAMRLLAKNPDERYPSCDSLITALDRVAPSSRS
ncbi:MAG: serine/threonine protein kinase [Proteobacteria bacterium]|nr:serine/threonine protein kinase [Pseudomonadota bacterium]